jgi:ABC-type cobalamin/Fe3+-siderophores transport system ATPase subunit
MLLGHTRIAPPPPTGLYPFLTASQRDPHDLIAHVSFSPQRSASGGAFYDFTARYGAVREEDRTTLRESLEGVVDDTLAESLDLKRLLDLPLVALSNGQTRRARILQALMRTPKPEVLVLTEPLSWCLVLKGARILTSRFLYSRTGRGSPSKTHEPPACTT